jgi:hypothetical protein
MSKKNAFEQVLDEIVTHVRGTQKYLFVGISDSETAEPLATLADTLERFWILRSGDKTIFFICDDETSQTNWWSTILMYQLYMAERGLPKELTDLRIIGKIDDLSCNVRTLRFLPAPKFIVNERVHCEGFFGIVKHAVWGYQDHINAYAWSYKINWEDGLEDPLIEYLPEKYLQKKYQNIYAHSA